MAGAGEGVALGRVQRYFFSFLDGNIFDDPSLEPSRRVGPNEG